MALAGLALALTGCAADCACVATAIVNPPPTVAAGETVTLEFAGVTGGCCAGGNSWPWSRDDNGPPESVNVVVRDGSGDIWVQNTVDVNDDATATAAVTLPGELPSTLVVTVDGEEVGRLAVEH